MFIVDFMLLHLFPFFKTFFGKKKIKKNFGGMVCSNFDILR